MMHKHITHMMYQIVYATNGCCFCCCCRHRRFNHCVCVCVTLFRLNWTLPISTSGSELSSATANPFSTDRFTYKPTHRGQTVKNEEWERDSNVITDQRWNKKIESPSFLSYERDREREWVCVCMWEKERRVRQSEKKILSPFVSFSLSFGPLFLSQIVRTFVFSFMRIFEWIMEYSVHMFIHSFIHPLLAHEHSFSHSHQSFFCCFVFGGARVLFYPLLIAHLFYTVEFELMQCKQVRMII